MLSSSSGTEHYFQSLSRSPACDSLHYGINVAFSMAKAINLYLLHPQWQIFYPHWSSVCFVLYMIKPCAVIDRNEAALTGERMVSTLRGRSLPPWASGKKILK